MAESVKLPVVGPISRRGLLIGGGAAVLVVGLVWYRKRQADQTAAAAVDPNTEDLAGLDSTDGGGGSGVAGGGAGGAGAITTDTVRTNPQWSALVLDALGGVVDPSLLAQAIGLYLAGSAVNKDQELIIDQAIAFAGYPPVAGPTGYPPAIRQSPAGGQTGGGDNRPGPPYPFGGTPADPFFDVTPRSNVDGWITALQRHGVHTSWSQVESLNGGTSRAKGTIWSNIKNGGDGKPTSNYFVNAARYKLPPQTTWFK